MRKILFLTLFFTATFAVFAAAKKFPVNQIPEHLKKDANVVKRSEEITFQIINTAQTVYRRRYALTILNEKGDSYAAFLEYYDKLRQIVSVEGALYDADGNQLKKLKSKEVQDISGVDDNNLIDDTRRKFHHFYHRSYPYTVEYVVEQRFNNTMFFPAWLPQESDEFAVEESSYTIVCPEDYDIRYRAFNYAGQPATSSNKGQKIMQWKVSALAAFKLPNFSPSWKELTTMVYFAPSNFEIQGYKGNMSTWKDFGQFQLALNAGKDVLPQQIVQKVQELTSGKTDVREKVKVLYQYLQKNTRYISIQLGLGGWQPFEAAYVASRGYGDCKALTNYMYSLLKAAGIASNYTLVYAGNNKDVLIEDFPSNRFNHVILCVPLPKDSMWLECTSQTLPAGYMSDFTANRKALMITAEGGKVVQTPHYGIKENVQLRTIKASLDAAGTLAMNVATRYGGLQQDDLRSFINALSKDKVQEVLQRVLSLSTYNINSFNYQEKQGLVPEIDEQLDVTVRNYATTSGKRIFVSPNILNRGGSRLEADEKRKVEFVFDYEFRDEDRVEIEIPDGYELEIAPKSVSIKTSFGSYNANAKLEGKKIVYTRIHEQYGGRMPATAQPDIIKFYNDVYAADRSKIVLVKK